MQRPNFLLILVDDMGWRDLGCTGSLFYETPNVDRLCAEGARFTQAYAACPVCSPTRASLLTGRCPARLGITNFIDWSGRNHPSRGRLIDAPYLHHLPGSETTVATILKDAGYQTWHVGKWHLGGPDHYPDRHGFDVNIGGCEYGMPVAGYFSPWRIPTLPDGPDGEYLTDRLTDEAIRLIEAGDGRPFFLNLWYYSVHTPIQAREPIIEKYRQKARDLGLDREPAFVEGLRFPSDHKRDRRITRRTLQSDPVYAAMIESLDVNIGRLLRAVESAGRAENTVVVFTSDNGGLATSEGSPTCNAPLAEGKGWMYEGGTREPLIVRWPGVAEPGGVCDVPTVSTDLVPTMLDAAGLDLRPDLHADGCSLAGTLRGGEAPSREAITWHFPHYANQGGTPGCSVRVGDWKLIEFFEDDHLELFDLKEDVGEGRNLAADEPARARELRERLAEWRAEVEAAVPQINPEYVAWEDRQPSGRFPPAAAPQV